MLLVFSWLMYVVFGVLSLVYPVQVSSTCMEWVRDKKYVLIGILVALSIVSYIVMICHYGFWLMVGVQVVMYVLSGVRSYFAHMNIEN